MVVKNVSSDNHKVHVKFSRLLAELLERGKPGLSNPVAGVFLKPRDSQAQMKVCGVEKTDH
jgi:hypothetical protein